MKLCFAFAVSLLFVIAATASTINVPADQPTIQAAINASRNGDAVLVAAGTYFENINFMGKAITVKSVSGAKLTIIDGGNLAPVATFSSGETIKSVLKGFTLQNGNATLNSRYDGGGVYIAGSSPKIVSNFIQKNAACDGGGGVYVGFGSPVIQSNTIQNNRQSGCSGGIGGGGIAVGGAASAQIIGNVIQNNSWGSAGGGITLFAAGTPLLKNNIIRGNSSSGSQGGGIWIVNQSDAVIVQNLIYNNTAAQGGGIYLGTPSGTRGPIFVNNTIVGETGLVQGAAVYATGFYNQVVFYNNLLIGLAGQNAVQCDATYSSSPPTFTTNDAYSPGGTGLQGTCAGQASTNGNKSVDPLFVSAAKKNFHLQAASPVIDAGTNSAPNLPPKDLGAKPRIVDGNGDGIAIVDMGVYEF